MPYSWIPKIDQASVHAVTSMLNGTACVMVLCTNATRGHVMWSIDPHWNTAYEICETFCPLDPTNKGVAFWAYVAHPQYIKKYIKNWKSESCTVLKHKLILYIWYISTMRESLNCVFKRSQSVPANLYSRFLFHAWALKTGSFWE